MIMDWLKRRRAEAAARDFIKGIAPRHCPECGSTFIECEDMDGQGLYLECHDPACGADPKFRAHDVSA